MKTPTLLTLALAALCAGASLVQAEDAAKAPGTEAPKAAGEKAGRRAGAGAGMLNPEERLKMMTEKLNLTQAQQDQIKAIYEKNGPQMRELMAKGRENLTDADKTKLRELLKEQMEEVGAVLTPEQKEKAKELRAERAKAK